MRTVLAVTGTRADYGIYKPVFDALHASPHIDLELIVTGMHLSSAFGHTVDRIEEDGFPILARIDTLSSQDTAEGTKQFALDTQKQCTEVFSKTKPDIVLVLGDRTEMLSAAKAAHALHIPIAHIHGGETSGSLDDAQRHEITKLSSIHLTSAKNHAECVKRLKPEEDPERIFVVGAPALDVVLSLEPIPKEKLFKELGFDIAKQTLLFVQHPDTLEDLSPLEQLTPSLEALESFDGNILIIGANADAGGKKINDVLEQFAKEHENCVFRISVTHEEYLSLLAYVDMLVGNSSSGIIEAASFNRSVVNIGNRQKGRLRSGNVLDVPYDTKQIQEAIQTALSNQKTYANAYGDGHAAEKITAILEQISL